ncbi:MAG: DUF5685 family protein [Agathobacter sp.]|nr:DUF5685 family protein [Agathobacter sp.]
MFGYIVCNRNALSKEERERYQSVYCGICKCIEKKFGQAARMTVNYDMTFLALFLSALYDTDEQNVQFRCYLHPLQNRTAVQNKFIDYAADMTVVLAYFKCIDDWEDEGKKIKKKYAELLEEKYKEVKVRYPRQCNNISECMKELRKIEKSHDSIPDGAINCSGKMLSEIFVYEEDFWSSSLRYFGYELGRFIYLMDAVMDYKKDIKKRNYNPVYKLGKKPEEMEALMTNIIGNACREFEKLPIVDDEHLLCNILYGGVWQKYYMKYHGKEQHNDTGSL